MRYVYVAGGNSLDLAMEHAITRQTGFALYSLISGLRPQGFGLHTVEGVTCDIREFSATFTAPVGGRIFVDSGGYSFIKGDVPPEKLPTMIDCYSVYVESEIGHFDYVFSLDIPFSLKHTSFNTVKNVYDVNRASMLEAVTLLKRHPELKEKFYFVWHFKMIEQYAIWRRLYSELGLSRYVLNHAVGGMVGLKKAAGIRFSPFTGISFDIVNNYIKSEFSGNGFRLHYLGVYAPYDRFHIALLERLFQRYLSGVGHIEMSYDSINPIHTVRMNANVPFYSIVGGSLEIFSSLLDAPDEILRTIAIDEQHFQQIVIEMDRRRNGIRLDNSAAFSPMNVFSNMQLDRFFEMIIEQYDFIGEMNKSSSPANFEGRLDRIFEGIQEKYPGAFPQHMMKSIMATLERTWHWHKWFIGKRDQDTLDRYMVQEIREIGFPGKLS